MNTAAVAKSADGSRAAHTLTPASSKRAATSHIISGGLFA